MLVAAASHFWNLIQVCYAHAEYSSKSLRIRNTNQQNLLLIVEWGPLDLEYKIEYAKYRVPEADKIGVTND